MSQNKFEPLLKQVTTETIAPYKGIYVHKLLEKTNYYTFPTFTLLSKRLRSDLRFF